MKSLRLQAFIKERYDNPDFTPDYLRGTLTFTSALPLIHTGSVAKKVYVRGAVPIVSDLIDVKDWVLPKPATQ